jgi:hypothetical protein
MVTFVVRDVFCIWTISHIDSIDISWNLTTCDFGNFIVLLLSDWSKVLDQNWVWLLVYALAVLSLTSFIYPINAIGLFMFFTPLDILWERLILSARDAQGKDKKPNPVLIQNFGPIRK